MKAIHATTHYKIENNTVYICLECTDDDIPCRICDKKTKYKGLGQEIKLRHLPISGKPCFLLIKPKRGICKSCDDSPTTNQRVDWYDYKGRNTKAYEEYLLLSLVNSTVTDVSLKEDVGYDTINATLKRRVDDKVDWSSISKIGLMGIDEVSMKKGYRDFVTLITSHLNQKTSILAVINGRKKKKILVFFRTIPKKLKRTIEGICCDMYDGYINASKEFFKKKVPVIVDRFHVAQLYRKSLIGLRKRELERLREEMELEKYKELKPTIALLRRNKEFVLKKEKDIVAPLFKESPALKKAYRYCCQLTGIYNSAIGKRKANNRLNRWMAKVQASDLNCFNRFIKTLKEFQNEIVAYFKGRHTSGFVEGFNNKVKVLKRRCYGIVDENSLFRRLFLDCSGYDKYLYPCGV